MKLKSEVKRKKNTAALDKLKLYQKQAKNKPAVKVGYPLGKAGSIKYPATGTPVASVAFWNEFGTHNADGSVHTPARPFFRTAISENKKKYKKLLQKIAKSKQIKKKIALVGLAAVADIQNKINAMREPPNAPATIKSKKGVNNPLVDTGFLKSSTTYEVISFKNLKK